SALEAPLSFPDLSAMELDPTHADPTRVTRSVLLLLGLGAIRWVDD
ncbi:MAG: hypothetical protein GXP55_21975, partial [Deltaproteobacteria bacterium]|nr:hypothetical protein [Deltaproteobacteria bacterium]